MTNDTDSPKLPDREDNSEENPEVFAVNREANDVKFSRRGFLGISGAVAAGVVATGVTGAATANNAIAPTRTPLPTASPTPGGECTISTAKQGIYVHVGPGRQRGIRDYLPVDTDFTVIGKAKDSKGVYWWQIEMENVKQAWVHPEDVETQGDCRQVIDVDAPPFVPAAAPQPTGTAQPTTVPGLPGVVQPGQTGINYIGPGGATYTLPCGSPIPPGAVCVCNCVTVPASCSCDGYCSCAGASHYWYPN